MRDYKIITLSDGPGDAAPVPARRLPPPPKLIPSPQEQVARWGAEVVKRYVNEIILPNMQKEAAARGLSLSASDKAAIHRGAIQVNAAEARGELGPMDKYRIFKESGLNPRLYGLAAAYTDEGHLSKHGSVTQHIFGSKVGGAINRATRPVTHFVQHVVGQIPLVGKSMEKVISAPGKANLGQFAATLGAPLAVAFAPEILGGAVGAVGDVAGAVGSGLSYLGSGAVAGMSDLSSFMGGSAGVGSKIFSGIYDVGKKIFSGIGSGFMNGLKATDPSLATRMHSWLGAISSASPGQWLARHGSSFYRFVKDEAGKLHITKIPGSLIPSGIKSQLINGMISPAPADLFQANPMTAGEGGIAAGAYAPPGEMTPPTPVGYGIPGSSGPVINISGNPSAANSTLDSMLAMAQKLGGKAPALPGTNPGFLEASMASNPLLWIIVAGAAMTFIATRKSPVHLGKPRRLRR